jgi:hypothetical protein
MDRLCIHISFHCGFEKHTKDELHIGPAGWSMIHSSLRYFPLLINDHLGFTTKPHRSMAELTEMRQSGLVTKSLDAENKQTRAHTQKGRCRLDIALRKYQKNLTLMQKHQSTAPISGHGHEVVDDETHVDSPRSEVRFNCQKQSHRLPTGSDHHHEKIISRRLLKQPPQSENYTSGINALFSLFLREGK